MSLRVGASVETELDLQSAFCGCRADQLGNGEAIGRATSQPSLLIADEHLLFDPLGSAGRIEQDMSR